VKRISFLLLIILSLFGCKKSSLPDENLIGANSPELLYSNSFESSSDTVGWTGYGTYRFYPEPSPNGGTQSLYITGGDVSPQAMAELPSLVNESHIVLKLWARSFHKDGSVRLLTLTPNTPWPTIWISFQDTVWKEYADTSLLPSGYKLQLILESNGKMGGDVLVDQIQILKLSQ
jgi:hypothetical protein